MKKAVVFLFLIISFLLCLSIPSYAESSNSEFDSVWELTDDDTREYLEELGIDEISFEDLFNLSPTRVIKFLFDICRGAGMSVFKNIISIVVMLIITAIAAALLKDSDKTVNVIYFICTLAVMSAVIVPISKMLSDAAAGIKTSAVFVDSYLPVMSAIIIASKNPSLALTYNSFSVFLSSAISTFADKLFVPCISALMSLNILSSFSFENYRDRLIKTVRRLIIIILSLFSTVYTGLLTTQSVLASSSDSLALKGIKFISGAFVPVVGSGVGDAISSVFSSFIIMKNTLGVFVIAVIIVINLPVMAELLVWYFALGFCSIISSMFGLTYITETIDNLASVISLLNIILFFITFVLTISTGIIIMMGK